MKKNLNKLATLALTGILMTGMSFGALANDPVEQAPVMSFNKVVTTDLGNYTYAPVTTFNFTVAAGSEEGAKSLQMTKGGDAESVYVYAGVQGAVTVGSATFDGSETMDGDGQYTKAVEFTVAAERFTKPGVFHYTLAETDDGYDGIAYDSVAKDLYVVMVNGDAASSYKCAGVFMVNKSGEKIDQIVNDYGEKNNGTHDIVISKNVEGNLGDKTRKFKFTVTVTGAEGEKYYVTDKDGTQLTDLVSRTAQVYELASGDAIHIRGLSNNDTVKVVEAEANTEGYTTTITKTGIEDANYTEEIGDNVLKGATVKVTTDTSAMEVKNAKNSTTPTGVVMNIAPYAAMILGAGAFAGVFLGRKKSEDEE